MRIYEFGTQWLTLGLLFLLVDYNTQWLEVVTLGGLVAGSLLLALWTTLLDRLGRRLAQTLRGNAVGPRPQSALPGLVQQALVLVGVLAGVLALGQLLPGYTLHVSGPCVTFLLLYGYVALALGHRLA